MNVQPPKVPEEPSVSAVVFEAPKVAVPVGMETGFQLTGS